MVCAHTEKKLLTPKPTFFPGLESLHILNDRLPEPYWMYMKDYRHYEKPVLVKHDVDHRPPKNLDL